MYGLDLFSGIGGITKALEGYVEPVAYCENDRYAQALLLSRMATGDLPLAPIWDDVKTLRGTMLPPVDIIYGGFPCQDISTAGVQKGLGGERSGLFFEIVRLACELRPGFIFLENVSAITFTGLGTIVGEFAKLRYDCRWGVLSASDVGAPHIRERWWLLAHASGNFSTFGIQHRECNKEKRREQLQKIGESNGFKPKTRPTFGRRVRDIQEWIPEPKMARMVHGLQNELDEIRGLGNAVVPAQAREAFERLMGLK